MPTAEEARAELARRELARREASRREQGIRYGNLVLPTGASPTAPVRPATALERRPRPAPPRVQTGQRDLRSLILDRPAETRAQRTQREGERYARDHVGGDVQLGLGSGVLRGIGGIADMGQIARDPLSIVMPGRERPSAAMERAGAFYNPTTDLGSLFEGAGQMLPNALFPGSAAARVASVAVPTITGEASRILTRENGYDEQSQANMRAAGQFFGALGIGFLPTRVERVAASATRPSPPRVKADPNAPVNSRGIRAAVATTTPAQMRAVAARLRALGIEPTLVDVTDEAGRGVVRAAASRMTPARTRVQDFAAGRAENLPDRMGQQARRIMSSDPRTPAEIAADLAAQRAASADTAYGAVRGEAVPMPARTAEALRTDYGRAAIREAAKRERDPNVRAALNRLADDALDRPNTPITVGMADRISRVLRGQARAAGADNDLAGLLHGYADDVQAPMREAVPGYGAAVDQYAAQSRIMGAADRGEDFLARNTDEFVASLQDLGAEGLPLARATARRAIERAAGENVSAAPGVARRLALAPEQQARNRALLGEADAQRLQDAMRAEEQAVANARYVAPNTGSQTQIRGADAAANFVDEAVTAGANVATGNKLGIVRGIIRWARESGLSDADAQLLAEAAIDPARLDAIIASQEARANPRLMSALKQIAARGAPVAALSAVTAMPSAAQARPQPPRQ